jgi:hypothetical protein
MVGLVSEKVQRLEGTLARSSPGPDELFSFFFWCGRFSFKAFHVLALAADKGRIHAGAKIILFDPNG